MASPNTADEDDFVVLDSLGNGDYQSTGCQRGLDLQSQVVSGKDTTIISLGANEIRSGPGGGPEPPTGVTEPPNEGLGAPKVCDERPMEDQGAPEEGNKRPKEDQGAPEEGDERPKEDQGAPEEGIEQYKEGQEILKGEVRDGQVSKQEDDTSGHLSNANRPALETTVGAARVMQGEEVTLVTGVAALSVTNLESNTVTDSMLLGCVTAGKPVNDISSSIDANVAETGNQTSQLIGGKVFESEGDHKIEMKSCSGVARLYHDKITIEMTQPRVTATFGTFEAFQVWYRPIKTKEWRKVFVKVLGYKLDATISQLLPGTCYAVCIKSQTSRKSPADTTAFCCVTRPSCPPSALTIQLVPEDKTAFLEWECPVTVAQSAQITGYKVSVYVIDVTSTSLQKLSTENVSADTYSKCIRVNPATSYKFAVQALFGERTSETVECELLTMKHRLVRGSNKINTHDQGRPVYQVPLEKNFNFGGGRFHILEMGKSPTGIKFRERVILVIGATGAGKTTLINSLINYVLDVDYKDEFRFKLVSEALNKDQSRSQTQNVSAYTLHHQDGFRIPYTLTIIDTPGFGDTGGIQRDMEIAKELYSFFRSDNGIVDHIDAVGFVAPASLPRLTPTQSYIFDSILSLFGKDIGENIFLLLTFADGKPPQIMAAMKAANIPHQAYFKFNNSAVFDDIGTTNEPADDQNADSSDDDEDDEEDFNEMFWNLGMKSFQKFTKRIDKITSKSLKLTRDVLEQRGRIELYIDELHRQVSMGLNKQEQLIREEEFLKSHEQQIDANKNFTYEVWEAEVIRLPIPGAEHNTTCLQCNYTCHQNCAIAADEDKAGCWAMGGGNPVKCRICPNRCVWDVHRNTKYHNVTKQVKKTKTSDDLKARYEDAQGKRLSVQQVIAAVKEDFECIQGQIMYAIYEIRDSLSILQNIALKDNPLSTVEYIDILIKSEEKEAKPGWQKRMTHLTSLRKRAEQIVAISKGEFDPFKDYRDRIEQARLSGVNFNDKNTWHALYKKGKAALQTKFKDAQQCATQ